MQITSRFSGRCSKCSGRIRKGEKIDWQRSYNTSMTNNILHHVAVCVNSPLGRIGFVISAESQSAATKRAESFSNRIGYVGGDDFQTAIRRAGMMERNEPGGWGPLSSDCTHGNKHGYCAECSKQTVIVCQRCNGNGEVDADERGMVKCPVCDGACEISYELVAEYAHQIDVLRIGRS